MKNIKTFVFFGSHELATPALEALQGAGLVPALVVSRPESGIVLDESEPPPHPVREWARQNDVPQVTSRRAAEPELQERITALEPDLLVVVDYGRPLPAELLGVAGRGAVELQGSLLPKLRGPHSLRAGLSAGDSKTGITAFLPNEEPWAGPILLQEELEIGEHETFVQLIPRAQELVREVVVQAVTKIDKSKKPKTRAQNEKSSTATSKISARHRRAPWHLNSSSVYGRLRAHAPHGLGAYCKIRPVDILRGLPMDWENAPNGEIGTYLGMRQGKLAVLCGEGTVFGITRICRPGDPPASASTFARQEGLRVGDRFI